MFYNIHISVLFLLSTKYMYYLCGVARTTERQQQGIKKIGATIKAAFTISEGKYSGFLLKNKDNVENLHKGRI